MDTNLIDIMQHGPKTTWVYSGAVPPAWRLNGRTMEEWHVLLIIRGHIHYGSPGQLRTYPAGSLILVPPHIPHSGNINGHAQFCTCRFDCATVSTTNALTIQTAKHKALAADWQRLHHLFQHQLSDLDAALVNHHLIGLLGHIARLIEQKIPAKTQICAAFARWFAPSPTIHGASTSLPPNWA